MSVESRRLPSIAINQKSLILVAIMVATQVCAYLLVTLVPAFSFSRGQVVSSPSFGIKFAGMIVVYSLVLVVLWRLYSRFPSWIKQAIRSLLSVMSSLWTILAFAAIFVVGSAILVVGSTQERAFVAAIMGLAIGALWLNDTDFKWILHNSVAFVLSIGVLALLGAALDPWVAIVVMVLLLAWDYAAVFLSDLMADLIDFSANAGIPNYYIIPSGYRIDLEGVRDFIKDPAEVSPPNLSGVIGVGDFVIPSLLVVSAVTSMGHVPAVLAGIGTLVSLLLLTAATGQTDGALPALPWVNTGAIAGFLAGFVVVSVA